MSITEILVLRMGGKNIFHENLSNLKSLSNSNEPRTNINNNYPSFPDNNSNINSFNDKKQQLYDNFDVLPKFIANKTMQKENKELTVKILKKKVIFEKMVNTYFSENYNSYIQSLNQIESEINGQEMTFGYAEKTDYDGFKDMLNFINENNTNENINQMQNMTLEDYLKISNENKNEIYNAIFNNRFAFNERLNLVGYYNNILMKKKMNNRNQMQNKNYNTRNSMSNNLNNNMNINMNMNDNINNRKKRMGSSAVTKEKIKLFKILVGNPQIPDSHVITYFDPMNPNVKLAAEKYFRNTYQSDILTLFYYYPEKKQTKVHKFRFTCEVKELFMAAQDDYMSMDIPKLFTESGKEIVDNKIIKCVGGLNIANNSKIKVVRY